MRVFKASQELVDILLKYGFTDYTFQFYPQHYQRMKQKGYDPYSMKRIFCFRENGDYILFNYIYITIHHCGYFNHTAEKRHLMAEELRSLIAFYKLPPDKGREWLEAYVDALELYKYYNNICILPELYNSETDTRIKQTYEHIILR